MACTSLTSLGPERACYCWLAFMIRTTPGHEENRDVLLGKVFPRRAQVIEIAGLRTLLQGTR